MSDEPTCGKGLAENAALPAKLSELTDALASVLEHHMTSLDRADPNGRLEYEAYDSLVKHHSQIASLLAETSAKMAGYRNLPMAAHNGNVLSNATAIAVFQKFAEREQELAAMLKRRIEADSKMLQEITVGKRR